jgi:hypothetical protein
MRRQRQAAVNSIVALALVPIGMLAVAALTVAIFALVVLFRHASSP